MSGAANDVVITGIGIVTTAGVGKAAHEALLAAAEAPAPNVDTERFAPYPVHPMPEIDWSEQIPRRGDQRQMYDWQRLGVYTAGLALDDAGLKEDADACSTMDMIVAAGGGERDVSVDTLILKEARGRNDKDVLLNEKLTTELRPTLFLAQLSNLLAGNISIVHKVTGSSRTFMGEESAGIAALDTAFARIRAGQSTHALVGAACSVERSDYLIAHEGIQVLAQDDWSPIWSRDGKGGLIPGSASAFLVLESRDHAEKRGARIYATLKAVGGDRGARGAGEETARLTQLVDDTGVENSADTIVFSGASGLSDITAGERQMIAERLPDAALRGYSGLSGHAMEAQFPLGVALAALALANGSKVPPFDPTHENAMTDAAKSALVTTVGYYSGEGAALLSGEGE